jgi:hypothetical protein
MEHHQNERPAGGQWAQQQKVKKQSQERQTQGGPLEGKQSDARTPAQPIGEVAYAKRDPAKKKTGEF